MGSVFLTKFLLYVWFYGKILQVLKQFFNVIGPVGVLIIVDVTLTILLFKAKWT